MTILNARESHNHNLKTIYRWKVVVLRWLGREKRLPLLTVLKTVPHQEQTKSHFKRSCADETWFFFSFLQEVKVSFHYKVEQWHIFLLQCFLSFFFFPFLSFITFIWSLSMTKNLLMDLISDTLQRLLSFSLFFMSRSLSSQILSLSTCQQSKRAYCSKKKMLKEEKKVFTWKENKDGAWKETPISLRERAGHLWGGRCFCFVFFTSLRNMWKSGILLLWLLVKQTGCFFHSHTFDFLFVCLLATISHQPLVSRFLKIIIEHTSTIGSLLFSSNQDGCQS